MREDRRMVAKFLPRYVILACAGMTSCGGCVEIVFPQSRSDKKRGGDRHRPFQVPAANRNQPAFFFARRNQVSTTVSGFSDTDSMP